MKFGTLIGGIRSYGLLQSMYTAIYLVRRLIYAVGLIALRDSPALVTSFIIFINITFIGYSISCDPHDSPVSRRIEIANESILMIITCHLLYSLFSVNKLPDPELNDFNELVTETQESMDFKNAVGWSMISFIVLLQAVNYIVIGYEKVKLVKWQLYIRKLKKRHA